MPYAALKYCRTNGCGNKVKKGEVYCENCKDRTQYCVTLGCGNKVTIRSHSPYCSKCRERRKREGVAYQTWDMGVYKTAKWVNLRNLKINRSPLCEECQRMGITTLATTVDHIVPWRGNMDLFFDIDNLQSLCTSCHNRKTAKEKHSEE